MWSVTIAEMNSSDGVHRVGDRDGGRIGRS